LEEIKSRKSTEEEPKKTETNSNYWKKMHEKYEEK
jgi:hypothetical protein